MHEYVFVCGGETEQQRKHVKHKSTTDASEFISEQCLPHNSALQHLVEKVQLFHACVGYNIATGKQLQ
jgi:hypothetical protein